MKIGRMYKRAKILDVRFSFWLLPSLITGACLGFGLFSVQLDHWFFSQKQYDLLWLFGGSSDAARDLLSVIAGSLITVAAVAFSVTIVALQQASTQYSPRVLGRFTEDRGNQLVLGAYIGTFVFSLVVLWNVRTDFIPALSIAIAGVLALIDLGLLVYFIHHITNLLRVSTILSGIREQLDRQFDRSFRGGADHQPCDQHYAEEIELTARRRTGEEIVVRASAEGYVRYLDEPQLFHELEDVPACAVWVPHSVGDYVVRGSALIRIWSPQKINQELVSRLSRTVTIEPKKSIDQNPLYGIRQIVDVALKALSPSLNDPTTAEECLQYLKGALGKIINSEFPPVRFERNGVQYLVKRPTFDDYLDICFSQIISSGRQDLHVMSALIAVLQELSELSSSPVRSNALQSLITSVRTTVKLGAPS